MTHGGIKHDGGKTRVELYPPEALLATSRVLTFGAHKYAERNWEKGIAYSRVYGALMRHLLDFWLGVRADPETGESPVHHAACCIAFLQTFEERGSYQAFDDRPHRCAEDYEDANIMAALRHIDVATALDEVPRNAGGTQ